MKVNKWNFIAMIVWIPGLTFVIIEKDIFFSIIGIIVLLLNSWFAFDNDDVNCVNPVVEDEE